MSEHDYAICAAGWISNYTMGNALWEEEMGYWMLDRDPANADCELLPLTDAELIAEAKKLGMPQ